MVMSEWLRRLICGDCECCKSQNNKRSKYAPERDIDTVQTGGYTPRGLTAAEAQQINSAGFYTGSYTGSRPPPPGKE